jgi:glycosyltransferase involved in cell wall biosynthesis
MPNAGSALPPALAGRRVVLIHDWLTGMRGGERVLESLCHLFPSADLFTLLHVPGAVSALIEARRIRSSFIQRLPRARRHYRQYLPVFPTAIEFFDLDEADVVISTSHCAAKAVVRPGRAVHVCYCHSPMRYAWDQFDAYFSVARVGSRAHRVYRSAMAWMARWDRDTAPRVDHFIANSRYVAGRIARYYNRRASVVYPPVNVDVFHPGGDRPEPHFLVVSALVPYKRVDVAIEAARLAGVRLKIVGTGPEEARLRALAGPDVEFIGAPDDAALGDAYRRASALVMPAEEDFGIAAVEAMACGRPVIAFARGGAPETVTHGMTGLLVDEATPAAFAAAMTDCRRLTVDEGCLRAEALRFAVDRFEASLSSIIGEAVAAHPEC